jgi:hypothetical protein
LGFSQRERERGGEIKRGERERGIEKVITSRPFMSANPSAALACKLISKTERKREREIMSAA